MKKIIIFFLVGIVVSGSMAQHKGNIELPPIKYRDFKTLPSPLGGFQPGYIFRIPKANKKQEVPVAIIGKESDYNKFSNPVPELHNNWKTKTFLSFLGIETFSASLGKKKENKLSVSFLGGVREQLLDEKIDELLKNSNINLKDNSDYYIINEAISFSGIKYTIIKYNELEVNARNIIDTLRIQGKISFESSKNDTMKFAQDFASPHRVFYKFLKITKAGSQSSGGNKFIFEKPKENIVINEYEIFYK